jgi:hypothetical protein
LCKLFGMNCFNKLWQVAFAALLFSSAANAAVAPSNDNFGSAQVLEGYMGSVSGNNAGATRESGEPNHGSDNPGGRSLWYRWVAPATGMATLSLADTQFDTVLAVYTGTSLAELNLIAANDDISDTNKASAATLPVASGTAYYIAIDGFNDSGIVTNGLFLLQWTLPPANDDFVNAQPLSTNTDAVTGTLGGSTRELGEPLGYGKNGTVWFRWKAPATGRATFQVNQGEGYAVDILRQASVFDPIEISHLVYVGDVGSTTSRNAFLAESNSNYWVRISKGYDNVPDDFRLSWSYTRDVTPPRVVIKWPSSLMWINTFVTRNIYNIWGYVLDDANGTGGRWVDVFIRRRSDGQYWQGLRWGTSPVAQRQIVLNGRTWNYSTTSTRTVRDWDSLPTTSAPFPLTPGVYSVTAVPYDQAGNKGVPVTVNVNVDSVAPTLKVASPVRNSIIPLISSIEGTVADLGGSGLQSVQVSLLRSPNRDNFYPLLYWNGKRWENNERVLPLQMAGGRWWSTATLPMGGNLVDGDYRVMIRAKDRAGNTNLLYQEFEIRRQEVNLPQLAVSTINAQAYMNSLQIRLTKSPTSAQLAALQCFVTLNGVEVPIENVTYNASTPSLLIELHYVGFSYGDTIVVRGNLLPTTQVKIGTSAASST